MTKIRPYSKVWQADVFQQYLGSVLQATTAEGVALLIEPGGANPTEPLLVHIEQGDQIPEMADAEAAVALAATMDGRSANISYLPSQHPAACLLRVAVGSRVQLKEATAPDGTERRKIPRDAGGDNLCVWIGLYFASESDRQELQALENVQEGAPQSASAWLAHTLIVGANLVWEAFQLQRLLRDPTSKLPTRAEFQGRLKSAFQRASVAGGPLGLLLLNPDEFGLINQRLGQESGDRAVAEIARALRGNLRRSDTVYRYGGAVFAVLMPKGTADSVEAVAQKLSQAMTGAYLDGAVRLTFSVGAVIYDCAFEDDKSLDEMGLLRRADHALNLAKRAGGSRSVIWNPDEPDATGVGADRLSGIFTADAEKDYRNMLLMWDTIAVISSGAQKQQIADEFVARINLSLKPSRVALIEYAQNGQHRQLALAQRSDASGSTTFAPTTAQAGLLDRVCSLRATEQMVFQQANGDESEVQFLGYAIPILVDKNCLGCLYLDGPEHSHALDSSDLIFLEALAGQLGLALDRADLAARWHDETERESKRLREEVSELRQVVQSSQLVYSSRQMQGVLDMLRAVAPTDVTILIDGESGTGKEVLARAIHELSDRKDKPLVIVDCGAIAHNLIEAELFGYVKGAYTGAHSASEGKIVQAEGGTVFLDEIGEVPLDVQAKLLRFVQEKEINPVGATKSRRVDTRIVAATNRDLASESAAGRFREDLYYRLKVVTVTSPPLRNRPDDILPLAKHFLEKFALQYQKPARRFSPGCESFLHQHQWPGNVRELQNSILRAVVLSDGDTIHTKLLKLESGEVPGHTLRAQPPQPSLSAIPGDAGHIPHNSPEQAQDPWASLQRGMVVQVEAALENSRVAPVPLGRWLTEDLVLTANELAGGNARRASSELRVAETTFRRQLDKGQRAESQGLLTRTDGWQQMGAILSNLVESPGDNQASGSVIDQAKLLLLEAVIERVAGNENLGSALMGVTVPTYRRWTQHGV